MSNGVPNINPTGTKYRNVRMYPRHRNSLDLMLRTQHTKEFTNLLKVIDNYIQADFEVVCWEEPVGFMNADLRNPLFPEHMR